MSENDRRVSTVPPNSENRDIIYTYGHSALGDFIAAVDKKGLCAILFGDNQADLLAELQDAVPTRKLTLACPTFGGLLAAAVARLIEHPSMSPVFPTSIDDWDLGQMVRAALSLTKVDGTVTPEAITEMIGASPQAVGKVRKRAERDLLAGAIPFHRMQEQDGSSPAYRSGEERRRYLLSREVAA
jgi:AraC family transcriptional regulator of adaptative response/methylated-DNA-[protein]-cysteine methyltransferase